MITSMRTQIGHILLGMGFGALRQIAQKRNHGLRAGRHFGGQRNFGGVSVAQQVGFFLAQGHDLGDQRGVVQGRVAAQV